MIKPRRLNKGDLIGVCAPSGVIKKEDKKQFLITENIFSKYGLRVEYSDNLFSNSLGYSATVNEKVSDLNKMIKNKEIKAIIFAKGGANANSILDKIEYKALIENPKIIMGFSDNTVLLNAINKKVDLITYHFTNYKGFCKGNFNYNIKQFEDTIIKGREGEIEKASEWSTIRKGKAKGRLVGGNLSSIMKILNTEYSPNFENNILFLEDLSSESDIEMISGYLYQLKQGKVFEKISGLLLGNYNSVKKDVPFEKIVMDVVSDYKFPIIKCNDFGHTENNIVLPIGLECMLNADDKKLIFEGKSVNKEEKHVV